MNGAKYPIFTLEITTRAEFFRNDTIRVNIHRSWNIEDRFSSLTKKISKNIIVSTAIEYVDLMIIHRIHSRGRKKREERHESDEHFRLVDVHGRAEDLAPILGQRLGTTPS